MINRRRFLQALAAAAASRPTAAQSARHVGFGALQPDANRVLDLPSGFRYDIVSRYGETMDDGLIVPALPDGMATFAGENGRVVLVCNHEIPANFPEAGAFGQDLGALPAIDKTHIYDRGRGMTPCPGGTTTIVWDPHEARRVRQHMSLMGTENNCAGGSTPWGSWLSCEECFTNPGVSSELGKLARRERRHGYVFEVPAYARTAIEPQPLTAMGRFEHEAAAVDPRTGFVYMTEDRHRSLLYRFIPSIPGRLASGGTLQALAVAGKRSFDTRNWGSHRDIEPGFMLKTRWINLPNPDVDDNDLRFRGFKAGAARFARGEGLCYADGEFVMTCTIGGSERLGQVFGFTPGATSAAGEAPGRLRLIAEATEDSLLRNADNINASPWGDLVICEDTAEHCGLVGLTPGGKQYPLADNAYDASELAGVCFSPDGAVMFVNIQRRGLTLAIRGPWARAPG